MRFETKVEKNMNTKIFNGFLTDATMHFFRTLQTSKGSMDDNNRLKNDLLNLFPKITGYMKVNAKLFLFTEAIYVMQFRLKMSFRFQQLSHFPEMEIFIVISN